MFKINLVDERDPREATLMLFAAQEIIKKEEGYDP